MSDASSDGPPAGARAGSGDSFAALFERSPRPMAAVTGTESPRVQIVNRAYLEQFDGRTVEDADGGSFSRRTELSGPEREIVRSAAQGSTATETVTKRTDAGHRVFAIRAIPAERTDVTAFLQYSEVTTRQIRDQQLAVLRRVLRHDLRNDLTVLLGFAQTIAETSDDPDARDAAETMIDAANDLRTVAESAGRMQCVTAAPRSTPLDDAVTRVRRAVGSAIDGRFSVPDAVPTTPIDSRVGVALEELCRTILQQGDATAIRLSADVEDGWATVTVEADGGISDQQLAALQGRDETKLRHATGIAPWIARWAVRATGGSLDVDRCDDDGSRVSIATPVLDATPRPDPNVAAWIER